MTVHAHAADHRSQTITLPTATSHNATWTTSELEFVREFADERDEEIALALNRTLYAVRAIRAHLDARIENASRVRTLSRRELVVTSFDEWERSFE